MRIEDTDQKRNTPTAAKQVMTDLRWLGIDWDEGPEIGGPNGPYLQSQRLDLYDKYTKQLLAEGKAYYCFETTEELDAMRKEAEKQKKAIFWGLAIEFVARLFLVIIFGYLANGTETLFEIFGIEFTAETLSLLAA